MFSLLQKRDTGLCSPTKLYDAAKVNRDFVQRLKRERCLEVHRGCVNTICWNESGTSILSGSDDQHLVISNPFSGKIQASIRSGHHSNIFCAKFLPNSQDQEIVSCSGAGSIYYTQVDREDMYGKCLFDCHVGTTYELMVVPNEARTFLTCGEDGTVRWFDLRIKTSCNKERCKDDVLINCRNAVTSISVDPVLPYQLATACADGSVRVFDRRMLGTRLSGTYSSRLMTGLVSRFLAPLENKAHRITSLNYSPYSHDILVSYSAENVYLFNTQLEESKEFSKTESESEEKGSAVNGDEAAGAAGVDPTNQPPTKRLRLRGDWSDTGPNARPERERSEDTEGPPQVNLMQRMSDMLTRWLDGSLRRRGDNQEGDAAPPAEGDNPEPEQQGAGNPRLDAAVSDNPSAEQDTGHVPQQRGEEGNSTLREESAAVEGDLPNVDQRGELLSIDVDGRGTVEEGGELDCDGDRLEGARSVQVSDKVDARTEDGLDSSDVTDTRSAHSGGTGVDGLGGDEEGSSSQQTDTRTEVKPDSAGSHESQTASAPEIRDCATERLDTRNPDSVSQLEDLHLKGTAEAGGSLSNQSRGQSEIATAENSLLQCTSQDEQENGRNKDGSKSAAYSQQPSVPQAPSDPAPDSVQDKISEMTDSRSTANLGAESGSDATLGDAGSSQEATRGADAASSPAVASPGAPAPTTRLEPVISLHYSQEGTTASTIHLGYSRFDIIDPPHGQTAPQEPHAVPAPPSAPVQDSSSVEVPPSLPSHVPGISDTSEDSVRGAEAAEDRETSPPTIQEATAESSALHPRCDQREHSPATAESRPKPTPTSSGATPTCSTHIDSPSTSASSSQRATTAGGAGPSSSRQRRVGHSGPPTGDFQLVLNENEDDDSDDDEEDRENLRSRSVPFWSYGASSNDERHYAAMCMQSMYRRRMEEREKQAMASVFQPQPQRMFTGHRNSRTMIKESNFWGERVVMSGSDCGRIFLWDRDTTELIMLLEADRHVVNCLQPHPYDPVLASSGIDYDVKIWSPLLAEPSFDSEAAEEVMRRNQIMLEETRDTITVPAAFMLRVLASLNQIRAGRAGAGGGGSGGGGGGRQQEESPGDSD